jgi:hypothetical protein
MQVTWNLLTSLETSNVGRHNMTISIKMLGIITASFIVSYQSPKMVHTGKGKSKPRMVEVS